MASPNLPRSYYRTFIWIILGCLVAAVIIFFAVGSLGGTFASSLSGSGLIALVLGVLFTVVLGVGLMALVFVSNRTGMDERGRHEGD